MENTTKQPFYLGQDILSANLVLEGGAMRGQFTAGVLDVFMEKGLVFKRAIGVSAGALNGYNYVAGEIGRTCYLNTWYRDDPRYLSYRSLITTGNIFNREFSFDLIPNELEPYNYDNFRKSPIELISVSSDLELGEADYHAISDPLKDLDYVIASSSLPLASKIVEVDGKRLLDGGTCDSVPLTFSRLTGEKKHVVVLTQDASYTKSPEKLMGLLRMKYSDYPYYLDRLEMRHFEYNRLYREIARREAAGEIFVIRPEQPVTISNIEKDPEKLFDLYLQGVKAAYTCYQDLCCYLDIKA